MSRAPLHLVRLTVHRLGVLGAVPSLYTEKVAASNPEIAVREALRRALGGMHAEVIPPRNRAADVLTGSAYVYAGRARPASTPVYSVRYRVEDVSAAIVTECGEVIHA